MVNTTTGMLSSLAEDPNIMADLLNEGMGFLSSPTGNLIATEVPNYYDPTWRFEDPYGLGNLAGATDIYEGRTYSGVQYQQPTSSRTGYKEMQRLNESLGLTTRPELPQNLSQLYLPYRPYDESSPEAVRDLTAWHKYYTDNPELRQYLSFDEQTELNFLDKGVGRYSGAAWEDSAWGPTGLLLKGARGGAGLPGSIPMSDFAANLTTDITRKHSTGDPYKDLLGEYGASIGGYWNPENDPGALATFANSPLGTLVKVAATAVNPLFGAAVAGGLTGAAGGSMSDVISATASTAAMAGLAKELELAQQAAATTGGATTGAITAGQAAATGYLPPGLSAASGGIFGLSPQVSSALIKGAGALAQGGDIKDALISAGLGYAGAPGGGMLSKTLGDLGLDVGQGVISKAVEGLSLADVAKFGYKSTEDFGSALGGLIQNMDLGTLEQTGLLSVLPQGIQDAVRKVEVSDLLASGVGGIDSGLAFNILNDINMPYDLKVGMLTGQVEIPQWIKDAYEAVEGVVQPAAQQVERVASKGYEAVEQAIQDATSAILPASPESMFNIPNVDLFASTQPISEFNIPNINIPGVNIPNVNIPDVNLPNVNLPNVAMPSVNLTGGQRGMFEEFDPYRFSGIRFQPRAPVIPTLQARGQDPLSILLRG